MAVRVEGAADIMPETRTTDFWTKACAEVHGLPPDAEYQVWHFGDGAALAQELAELVLRGPKRATAGLLWEAESDPNAMPMLGGYSVVTDGGGAPQMVLRTSRVEIRPFAEVDADFAAAEGEGDGSLEYWRAAHWSYFSRRCEVLGRTASEEMPVILERFELVYPVKS
jgi:uncharacterized protein YhfF